MVLVVGYLGYRQNDADKDTSTRAALAGCSFLFLVHCFLQCRDTLFVRPHPGFWRLVHGVGMLYLLGVAVLLFHTRAEARRLLAVVFTDMGSYSLTPPAKTATAAAAASTMDCTITWAAVKGQLQEVWFIAHVAGWWAKMCLFRDWHVCWGYDWKGGGMLMRAAHQFSPFSWSRWEWGTFTSFKRFCQIAVLVIVVLATELNAFMMLNALDVPKTSSYNATRLAVLFAIGLPGANEFYEYITNPHCSRLGQNTWLVLAILQVEVLVWSKFLPQSLLEAESPAECRCTLATVPQPRSLSSSLSQSCGKIHMHTLHEIAVCIYFVHVRVPWLATLSLLGLWTLLAYITHKQTDSTLLQRSSSFNVTPPKPVANSTATANNSASTHNTAAAADAKRALLSNSSSSNSSSNADSRTTNTDNGSTTTAAAAGVNSSGKRTLKRERTRSFSDTKHAANSAHYQLRR
eukprot:5550-Heterococcus_DN1.PRE.1